MIVFRVPIFCTIYYCKYLYLFIALYRYKMTMIREVIIINIK